MIVEIIILRTEINYDIEAIVADFERQRHIDTTILPADGAGSYFVGRYINKAIDRAVSIMQAYLMLPSVFVKRIATDHAELWEEKCVKISLPHNWPPHNINALKDSVHDYIVHYTVHNILKTSFPTDNFTLQCYNDYIDDSNAINANINARLGAIKIKPTIFG